MNRSASKVMLAVVSVGVLGMAPRLAGAQAHPAAYQLDALIQAPFGHAGRAHGHERGAGLRLQSQEVKR